MFFWAPSQNVFPAPEWSIPHCVCWLFDWFGEGPEKFESFATLQKLEQAAGFEQRCDWGSASGGRGQSFVMGSSARSWRKNRFEIQCREKAILKTNNLCCLPFIQAFFGSLLHSDPISKTHYKSKSLSLQAFCNEMLGNRVGFCQPQNLYYNCRYFLLVAISCPRYLRTPRLLRWAICDTNRNRIISCLD